MKHFFLIAEVPKSNTNSDDNLNGIHAYTCSKTATLALPVADVEAPKCKDDVAPERDETPEQDGEIPPCSSASNSSAPTSDKTKKGGLNTQIANYLTNLTALKNEDV